MDWQCDKMEFSDLYTYFIETKGPFIKESLKEHINPLTPTIIIMDTYALMVYYFSTSIDAYWVIVF